MTSRVSFVNNDRVERVEAGRVEIDRDSLTGYRDLINQIEGEGETSRVLAE